MDYENLKYDFPKMPEEMRNMIEKEVAKQIKTGKQHPGTRKTAGRTIAASMAVVLLCGTTVFAGAGLYRMRQQKTGDHGVSVNITADKNGAESAKQTGKAVTIPQVKLETGYLPEGMVCTEQGKYSFPEALNKGGVSMMFYRMDTGDDKFKVEHEDVLTSEEFAASGGQGIYLEYPHLYKDDIDFNKRIYVAFTDVHYVMEMYAASDVSKEDAIKIAEQVSLVPVTDADKAEAVLALDWSVYDAKTDKVEGTYEDKTITKAAREDINIHQQGESFPVKGKGLTARVTDVKVMDDISLLDARYVDEDFRNELDGNGKLLPATIQYIKDGNKDTVSQEISSRQVPQKLVYITTEYTNTGDKEMKDVLFFGQLIRIREEGGQMQIAEDETPGENDNWDRAVNHGLSAFWEMPYYDVRGGERNNNYIASIMPGETATVHMAWVVTEEELDKMFISLEPSGGTQFREESVKTGYVDIRQ